jgi:hypothetical protein
MVGERADIVVRDLEWDAVNEEHFGRHRIRRSDVMSVLHGVPRFFVNLPSRRGTHVMLGPTAAGVYFLVTMRQTDQEGVWRPVTGWHLGDRKGRQLYNHGQ